MKQNNVFIMWVPFGAKFTLYDITSGKIPKPVKKEYDNFSQQNCQADFQGGDNGTVFTVCDAGSDAKGMARIFQVYFPLSSLRYVTDTGRWSCIDYRQSQRRHLYICGPGLGLELWNSRGLEIQLTRCYCKLEFPEVVNKLLSNGIIARSRQFMADRGLQLQPG